MYFWLLTDCSITEQSTEALSYESVHWVVGLVIIEQ